MPPLATLNLVLASDENGVQGLAVAASSALEHTHMPVTLWVIQQGISMRQQQQLRALWQQTGRLQQLHFMAPPALPAWWATRQYPLIAWARMQMDRILPETVSRCVYIDIDVLVGADLAELAAMPMQGCILGMVRNTGLSREGLRYVESLGLTQESYYNSGVLLMDMDAWRLEGAREGLIARRSQLPVDLLCVDQDLMNVYFGGRILALQECWNRRDAAAPLTGSVLHFAGRPKPWQIPDFSPMPSGMQAWKQALDRTGIQYERAPLWRRLPRYVTGLRARAERLVRRRL